MSGISPRCGFVSTQCPFLQGLRKASAPGYIVAAPLVLSCERVLDERPLPKLGRSFRVKPFKYRPDQSEIRYRPPLESVRVEPGFGAECERDAFVLVLSFAE